MYYPYSKLFAIASYSAPKSKEINKDGDFGTSVH